MRHLVLTIVALIALSGLARTQPLSLESYTLTYNDADSTYVIDVWTVPDNFINTGLAYDPARHLLYCSHLGPAYPGEAIETLHKRDGSRAAPPLIIDPFAVGPQGLTYDLSDGTFWVWSGPGPYEERRAVHLSAEGRELPDTMLMPGYPGMLEYAVAEDGIWSKENLSSSIKLYDCASGVVIDSFDAGFGGEGIARDPFDGTFWGMTNSYVHHFARDGGQSTLLASYPNPSHHYPPDVQMGYTVLGAAEGMVVDPSDRTLWFNADQHFHGGVPGGNRCWHIDPLQTFDKRVLLPRGMGWQHGAGTHTVVEEGALHLAPGQTIGTFIAPVIDMGEYAILGDSLEASGAGDITVAYRGAESAPTTTPILNLTLPYHDANDPGEGWGTTATGPWTALPPATRFVQVRFTLEAPTTGVAPALASPGATRLSIAPQPSRTSVRIRLAPSRPGRAKVDIYAVSGRHVRSLLHATLTAGRHTIVWDGTSDSGQAVLPGTYFCRLQAASTVSTRKITWLR